MKKVYKILICAGAAIVSFPLAFTSQIALLPLIALAAYMGSEWGLLYLLPPLAGIASGVIAGFSSAAEMLPQLVMLIGAAIILTAYAKKRFPHRFAVLGLAVLICVGYYFSMTLGSLLDGKAPHAGIIEEWDNVYYPRFSEAFSGMPGGQDMLETMNSIPLVLPDLLMWLSVLAGEAYSLALVLLFRLWHKAFGTKPARMAPLAEWRLPGSVLAGSLLMLAAIGLVYLLKLDHANSIAYSLGLIVASMFAVQGFAYLIFMFTVVRAPKFVRVLLWIFSIIFFPYSMGFLAFMGIKEQLTKRRSAIRKLFMEQRAMRKRTDKATELEKYGYVRKGSEHGDGSENNENESKDG